MSEAPRMRVARPSDDLGALIPFYRDGLGLEILGSFEGHDGFDGIMFGRPGYLIISNSRTPADT
jgi:hypothetical protein